jgi:hypothetical protein
MTSTTLVREEIVRFLQGTDPEVLCVTGKWGVGKTFIWKAEIEAAQTAGKIGLGRYAYVSLFGLDSLDDLKSAIISETVEVGSIGKVPDIGAIAVPKQWLSSAIGWATRIGSAVPGIREYFLDTGRLLFSLLVRRQVICIDDLERAGDGLSAKNVLGLISFLKEEKKCRVVLLLNQGALEGDDQASFEIQVEKVIDTRLEFKPTAADAISIAITGTTKAEKYLSENCVKLGITNIRVIQKLKRLALRLEDLLKSYDETILWQAIHTETLLGWMIYQPTEAPPLRALTEYDPWAGALKKDNEPSAEEKAWKATFSAYKFSRLDEFDEVILSGVRSGFFDAAALREQADVMALQIEANKTNAQFSAAWRKFHDSFDIEASVILSEIEQAFSAGVRQINPTDLSATVTLFKDLGEPERGKALLEQYMAAHPAEGRDFFDLAKRHFGNEVKDPDVRAAFKTRLDGIAVHIDPLVTLKRITENDGWNTEDVQALARLTVDDYIALFKGSTGRHVMPMVQTALKFGTYGNATNDMKKVTEVATQALRKIAAESKINEIRMRRFGIAPDDGS